MREYKGHTVQIKTWQRGSRWDWSYSIDGGHQRPNTEETAPSQAIAEDEAFDSARFDIDEGDFISDEEADFMP